MPVLLFIFVTIGDILSFNHQLYYFYRLINDTTNFYGFAKESD